MHHAICYLQKNFHTFELPEEDRDFLYDYYSCRNKPLVYMSDKYEVGTRRLAGSHQ